MSECSLSGRGQGHVSNFYIVDLENFATASRRFVYDTRDNGNRLGRVMVECTLFMTHCLPLNLQLHTISLVRTCRISSFCTVAWQLARLLLTRRIARSLGDSCASCQNLTGSATVRMWSGRAFQVAGPACENARSPSLQWL